jgi:hypothetical protein
VGGRSIKRPASIASVPVEGDIEDFRIMYMICMTVAPSLDKRCCTTDPIYPTKCGEPFPAVNAWG